MISIATAVTRPGNADERFVQWLVVIRCIHCDSSHTMYWVSIYTRFIVLCLFRNCRWVGGRSVLVPLKELWLRAESYFYVMPIILTRTRTHTANTSSRRRLHIQDKCIIINDCYIGVFILSIRFSSPSHSFIQSPARPGSVCRVCLNRQTFLISRFNLASRCAKRLPSCCTACPTAGHELLSTDRYRA